MKVKKDIKYIIKRIIIGVGVALILANINKCNVYADTPSDLYLKMDNYSLNTSLPSGCTPFLTFENYLNHSTINRIPSVCDSFDPYEYNNYIVFYNSSLNLYYYISISIDAKYNFSSFDFNKISFKFINNSFAHFYNNSINGYDYSYNSSPRIFSFAISTNDINISSYLDRPNVYPNPKKTYLDNSYYFYTQNSDVELYSMSLLENSEIVSTNFEEVLINDEEQDLPLDNIPPGYSEINLQNKQGVYFVPKDYSTIPTELVSSIKFIKFPFYYKGNIKTAYFDLKNNNKIVFDFTQTYSSSEFEFVNTSFPMYYEENGTFSEDPNGYIIYNNVISDSSIVRYNSDLFNAYVIEDMNNYSDNITFTNENGESETLSISFNKSLQEVWEDGIVNGGEHFSDFASKNNLYKFFDVIKFPFTYINSLNNTTCIPLSFDLPFINYTLSVPCLSFIFQNYFGRYYDLIRILISGIVLYNVFLVNFYTVIEVLKPQSSQVEVVDL